MIALNANLDVEEVLGLLSSGRAIVKVDDLAEGLQWSQDRLENVLMDLESEGLIQSLEDPDGVLITILSPYGAETRGVKLDNESRRWIPIDKPELCPIVSSEIRATPESDVMTETNGRVFLLDDLPGGRETDPAWTANINGLSRRLGTRIPRMVRTGSTWPVSGTRLIDLPVEGVGVVREMMVVGSTCPVCGRSRPDRQDVVIPDCLICESWLTAYQKRQRLKMREKRKKERREAASAGTTIRFKPRLTKAKAVHEV